MNGDDNLQVAQKWHFEDEVEIERAIWHCSDENVCLAATDSG